jgi:hypothetical protein
MKGADIKEANNTKQVPGWALPDQDIEGGPVTQTTEK